MAKVLTVRQVLAKEGFLLKRGKKHFIFERKVAHLDGDTRLQVFSISSTPSDWRSDRSALAELRRVADGR